MLRLAIQGARPGGALPARSTLRRWVLLAAGEAAPSAQITLRFVGITEGQRLNRAYRGRDYPTNVLTFAYARSPLAADIVLCLPVIRREAREQGKSLRAHLAHLVVHGVLHARGHDHARPRQAAAMEALERALLGRLRIADPYAFPST